MVMEYTGPIEITKPSSYFVDAAGHRIEAAENSWIHAGGAHPDCALVRHLLDQVPKRGEERDPEEPHCCFHSRGRVLAFEVEEEGPDGELGRPVFVRSILDEELRGWPG